MASLYRGFSTYNRKRKFSITDFDLVKQDLFNHLHIRKGEKLMNPEFGTVIWNILFEPMTSEIKNIVVDDLKKIVAYDPRLSCQRISLSEYEHGLQVDITLTYLTKNITEEISAL